MIWLYSGTPGSGKSLHAAKDIAGRLRRGGGLICNFPVNEKAVESGRANFLYVDNSDLTCPFLISYAKDHHVMGKEGQTLVIIDECQILYNCRTFGQKDRNSWVKFFSQHRKYGYNVILIAQNDRMIDRQIRALIEYEVKHRKLSNYGFGGMVTQLLSFGCPWFIAIEYWYGGNSLKLGSTVFRYSSRLAKLYDSYKLFDLDE